MDKSELERYVKKGHKFREPIEGDAVYLAENLREEDVRELEAANGKDVNLEKLLTESIDDSVAVLVWEGPDGNPVAVVGLAQCPTHATAGIPWFLGTEDVRKYSPVFYRATRTLLSHYLNNGYGFMYNYVHADNNLSKKYLAALGFEIEPAKPNYRTGELFHRFKCGDFNVCMRAASKDILLTS